MKRLLATTALFLALPIVLSQPVRAMPIAGSANGAQKVVLHHTQQSDCSSTEPAAGLSGGFAILNLPGQPATGTTVQGEVAVKKALPDTDYVVLLEVNGWCQMVGKLRTNDQGNGNLHFTAVTYGPGTYQLDLMACAWPGDTMVSDPATLN